MKKDSQNNNPISEIVLFVTVTSIFIFLCICFQLIWKIYAVIYAIILIVFFIYNPKNFLKIIFIPLAEIGKGIFWFIVVCIALIWIMCCSKKEPNETLKITGT